MASKLVVLGAGITGRLIKILFPEALVLESKSSDSKFTAEVGVQISIVPIPELKNTEYKRYISIDGEKPTIEAIGKYRKKISRDGAISYGDYRQFEPEQIVYKQEFPKDLDIQFNQTVQFIDLPSKTLFISGNGEDYTLQYDYLISTIPLLNLIQISNLCTLFKNDTSAFFMHRPIYMSYSLDMNPRISTIFENYITNPDIPVYRENFIDGVHNQESLFKLPNSFKIYPGKIYPSSHTLHILEDLKSYRVFCVGRYAQWDSRMHLWNTYTVLKILREVI